MKATVPRWCAKNQQYLSFSPGNRDNEDNVNQTGGEGDNRGWDGWMASLTQWTWVWVNSGSWWWTGRPGVLRFMGLQRVRHDWATELNWTERVGHDWATELNWTDRIEERQIYLVSLVLIQFHMEVSSQWLGSKWSCSGWISNSGNLIRMEIIFSWENVLWNIPSDMWWMCFWFISIGTMKKI